MQVGEIVGNYRIAGELGSGDVGAVYLAKHTLIGREAAIQVLPPELCSNAVAVAQFLSEAKSTAGIKHPGLVEVIDSGYTRDGLAYLVMERLEGESLGARLRRKGKLPLEQAVAIARQVSGALYAAHKIGIVHRGLKPDCITLVADPDVPGGERAKILDFGVARLRESDQALLLDSQKSGLAAAYMAPEQCDGSDRVDHRTDLYALGCILFELVCGRPPFDGMSHGVVLAQHMREAAPPPSSFEPSVGRDLDQLILRLLEKAPDRRFPDAFELLTRFHELSGLAAPTAPVPGSITMLNTPAPEGPSGVSNPTVSGVVSSARRTLALGPRYRGSAQDSLPRTVMAAGTQRRKHPRDDETADPDAHEETIDREATGDATQDDDLPSVAGETPFGPMLDESSRGGLYNDPSVDRLLPIPPPPSARDAMADAAMASAPAAAATQMMGSGSSGPPRGPSRIAPGTAAVPVSAAPPGPPPPPGSPGRPGGSGGPGAPGSGGPPPPPGAPGGRTMAMPPAPPAGGPPPPSGPLPSTAPAGKSREPFGGTGDLIMTLPAISVDDQALAGPRAGAHDGPHGPPGPHGAPGPHGPPGPHGAPGPHGPHGSHGPPGPHGSPPPGGFASPPGGFASPPGGFASPPPGGFASPPPGGFASPPPGGFASPPPGGFASPPSGSGHGGADPSMGGPPFPPPFPPGPPGTSAGPHGGPMGGPMGPGGPPPPAPPLGPPGGPPPPAPPLGVGGPPPPAPPLGPGGPRDFGPQASAPTMYNEPFPRPMVRREDALRAGMHVPPPRASGTSSRAVRIGGLIVAVALGIGVVSAYAVATRDDGESEPAKATPTAAAAGATGADTPAATTQDAGATDKVAAAAASDAGAGAATAPSGAGAAADAGAADDRPADDKVAAAGDTPVGERATDDKPVDDKPASDKPVDKPADDKVASAADKPADGKAATAESTGKPADDKAGDDKPADKPAGDKVASGDKPADDKPADKPADDKPADKPAEPVEDTETRRRPAALITLQIDSLPRGAAVIRKRDGVRLGETPFTYQTEPQSSPISIILRHRGYRDEQVTLPGNRSADRRVPLTRTDGRDRAPSLKD